uniref:Uncharacterized protein n=1 Tax=uncultured bacterium A1Q1_fos_660 TaxID=1256588 RepID=L7VUL6_9BACT|nr:hypothetical protein [uncultured bacterium A1Q1_fos_660]
MQWRDGRQRNAKFQIDFLLFLKFNFNQSTECNFRLKD